MQPFDRSALLDPTNAAVYLLGCAIVRQFNGEKLVGRIVETEVYHQTDAASHSFRGPTPRTEVMFGPAGRAYIYFSYGVHWCMNITAGHEGEGAAVLIRALEPLQGIETMQTLRGGIEKNIANGPGKLTQALAIDKSFYGHDLTKAPLQIYKNFLIDKNDVITTTRVGISKAQDAPLRFYLKNSPYISRG